MNSVRCTNAIHQSIVADASAYRRWPLRGYQVIDCDDEDDSDVQEMRNCPLCDGSFCRDMGIGALLAHAKRNGFANLIGICRRALKGDEGAIASYLDAAEMYALTGGPVVSRSVTQRLPVDWAPEVTVTSGPDCPAPSAAMKAESKIETTRIEVIL